MEQIAMERLMKEKQVFSTLTRTGEKIGLVYNFIIQMFYANPMKKGNDTRDLYKWECGIPGPKNVLLFNIDSMGRRII